MKLFTIKCLFIFSLFALSVQVNAKQIYPIDESAIKTDSLLWNLKHLSETPSFSWLNKSGLVRSLAFNGLMYKGKPIRIFAYYSNPALLRGINSKNNKYPGIILVHGGGGRAFKEWVEKWAADGYAALAVDLSGTGGNEDTFNGNGPRQDKKEKFEDITLGDLNNMWSYHAVADIILAHSLLLSFPEVNAYKTVITGISWGGYLTCLAASLDNRFKAAAPVYGCGFYSDCVFQNDLTKMTPKDSLKWLNYFDPSVYLPFAQPKFLFINGNKDAWFYVNAFHKTYSLIKPNQRTVTIFPDMKHSHIDGWAPEEIKSFFDNALNNNFPLMKVGKVEVQDSALSVSFKTNITISTASFYYTNDLKTTNSKREWIELKATIDNKNKTVFSKRPEFKIGFFTLKDVRSLSVSSEFIYNL
jgi:cephalosporin-C deacetylase-like acetyl esterase